MLTLSSPLSPVKVFYHMIDQPVAHEIGREQVDLLFSSNLVGNTEIYLCLNYNFNSSNWDWVKNIFAGWPNVHIIDMQADPREYEMPTLVYLKEMCDKSTEPFYCLYMHQKGCTWYGNETCYPNILDWRALLEYFNITRWRDNVRMLDAGYDMSGINYRTLPIVEDPHYSGNFWWANSEYIKRIPKLQRPSIVNFKCQFLQQTIPPDELKYRMECELWHGRSNPNYAVLHDSMQDHYWFPYPKERYRNDLS